MHFIIWFIFHVCMTNWQLILYFSLCLHSFAQWISLSLLCFIVKEFSWWSKQNSENLWYIHLTEYSHKWWFCSNDDIDGNTSLGSTDELWSSPKDLIVEVAKSSSAVLGSTNWEFGALGNSSANIKINSKYLHNENPCVTPGCQKADSVSPYPHQTIGRHVEQEEYAVDSTGLVEEKVQPVNRVKLIIFVLHIPWGLS